MPAPVTHVCPLCKGETFIPHTTCIPCTVQEKLKRRHGEKHMKVKWFPWITKQNF